MPSDLPKGLVKLLVVMLKHQTKRWLDDDAAEAIGDIAGENVQKRLESWLGERATQEQLLRAAQRADEYFQNHCRDLQLKQAFTLRFWDLPSVQEALADLPDAMDVTAVRDAVRRALDADLGPVLTEKQRAQGAELYAEALQQSVGLLKDFALPVMVQVLFDMRRTLAEGQRDLAAKLDCVLAILEQKGLAAPPPTPTLPGDLPIGSYLPIQPNPYFTGREAELEALYRALVVEDRSMVINQRALVGMGGIGKTQLAVEFAWRYGYRFVGVHWVVANRPLTGGTAPTAEAIKQQIEASIAECGRAMSLPNWPKDDTAQQAAQTINAWKAGGPRLVILDNLEDTEAAAHWLALLRHSSVRILVTSRQADWPPACGLEPLPLHVFTEDESLNFLRRYLPPERASDDDLRALHERLGGLPLALDLAAAYLAQTKRMPVAEYLGQLSLDHESLRRWRAHYPNATRHDKDVAATFALSWAQVSEDAARRLFLVAGHVLPNTPLREDVVKEAAGLDDAQYDQAIGLLQGLSLLQPGPSIHPLLAEFARLLDEDGAALFAWSLALARRCYPHHHAGGVWSNPDLVPHARYGLADMRQAASRTEADANARSALCFYAGFLHQHFGDLDRAMALYQESLKIKEGLGDLQGKAAILHEMAYIWRVRGDLDRAMALYQESLKIKEGLGDQRGKAATLAMLAQVLIARGDEEEALKALLASLETLIQIGAKPDAEQVAGILADWRGMAGPERFDVLWRKVTGHPVPDWLAEAGGQDGETGAAQALQMTVEQFIAQVIGAAREKSPEAEQWFSVCSRMAADPAAPDEVRALGAVLWSILAGIRDVDLSVLPPAWAEAIRAALEETT